MKSLSRLSALAEDLEYLISSGNTPGEAERKTALVKQICTAPSGQTCLGKLAISWTKTPH